MLFSLSISLDAKEIDITKSKGTNQEVITSLYPEPMDDAVKRGANIKITFDKKLKREKIQKSIKLKYLGCKQEKKEKLKQRRDRKLKRCNTKFKHNKHLKKSCKQCVREVFRYQKRRNCKPRVIQGKIRYLKNRDILRFNPNRKLRLGFYQVTVKGLKTTDNKKIKKISYRFEVSKDRIETITLSQTDIKLQEQESTKLTLQATYKDGKTEDITKDINWIIGDTTLVSIDADGNLKALKEGETLLQAEYHGKVSDEVKVTITKKAEVINGYTLPPEPDSKINNATLLGVDVNNNGVRDDVERYIIKRFAKDPEFPKTKTAIALQYAWADQKIIENPTKDSMQYEDNACNCEYYWYDKKTADMGGYDSIQWTIKHKIYDNALKEKIFNTKERIKQYIKYNSALSGGIYQGSLHSINNCQTNIDVIGE